jgi:energy-coupling factor transport system substrate-specific component
MKKKIFSAREVALIGVMAATLECGKLALYVLPNIEVVTILCALYGYVFGWYGVVATVIFTLIEILIHGFGSWVISYLIYWPLVTGVFVLLGKKGISGRAVPTLCALGLTVLFGVLTTVVDTAFMLGINESFLTNATLMYVRGMTFYINQIVCNAVIFPVSFPYLVRKIDEIKRASRFSSL